MPIGKHQKRISAPKAWFIKRKITKWVTASQCGPHNSAKSIPLKVLLTDMLKYAKTVKEVKRILREKQVLVNKVSRNDYKFPVGIMDTIEVPATNEHFRMLLDHKGRLFPHNITKEEAGIRPVKIIGKKIAKNKKIMLKFFDGTNMLVDKDSYNIGDTLLLETGKKGVKGHLKFEKGAIAYIIGGKQAGKTGEITGTRQFKSILQPDNVILKTKEGEIETKKFYAFVIGEKAPLISLPEQ